MLDLVTAATAATQAAANAVFAASAPHLPPGAEIGSSSTSTESGDVTVFVSWPDGLRGQIRGGNSWSVSLYRDVRLGIWPGYDRSLATACQQATAAYMDARTSAGVSDV